MDVVHDGGRQAQAVFVPEADGGVEVAALFEDDGGGLQVAEVVAAFAGGEGQVLSGVFFKVDEAGGAVGAGDDVAREGFAQVLPAFMHGADGSEALLPAGEVVGFVFDALQQGVFAEVGEHDAVRRAREQMRHADAVRFQGLQALGLGRDDGAAAGVGHGFERIEVENGGEVAD